MISMSSFSTSICILGAVKMREEEGTRRFLKGLDMRANTFFEVSNMGLGIFLRLKKWGQELFLACEIGRLVVLFNRQIPQNPAWVPGKFGTVP